MTYTEKELLFNGGEQQWTDTWYDIFPEEVIQLIYRFVYNDAVLDEVHHHPRLDRLCKPNEQYMINKKYKDKGWTPSSKEYDNWLGRLEFTHHNLKRNNVFNNIHLYTESCLEFQLYSWLSTICYPRYINYYGFKFRQQSRRYYNEGRQLALILIIEYVNSNVGKILLYTNPFDMSILDKKSKRFLKYPDDFDRVKAIINKETIQYYNAFKQD